jgi:hypothetical protein
MNNEVHIKQMSNQGKEAPIHISTHTSRKELFKCDKNTQELKHANDTQIDMVRKISEWQKQG